MAGTFGGAFWREHFGGNGPPWRPGEPIPGRSAAAQLGCRQGRGEEGSQVERQAYPAGGVRQAGGEPIIRRLD